MKSFQLIKWSLALDIPLSHHWSSCPFIFFLWPSFSAPDYHDARPHHLVWSLYFWEAIQPWKISVWQSCFSNTHSKPFFSLTHELWMFDSIFQVATAQGDKFSRSSFLSVKYDTGRLITGWVAFLSLTSKTAYRSLSFWQLFWDCESEFPLCYCHVLL